MNYTDARQAILTYCVEECEMIKHYDCINTDNCVQAIAINALDKQIKKKPLGRLDYLCPNCKSDNIEIYFDGNFRKMNYCPDCGQAIDWT